jgi:hypothetical protein
VRAATAAESLRQRFPGRLVFCVGTESSLFTRGIVPGRSVGQRVANIRTAGLRSSPYAGPLQAFLAEASQRVRLVLRVAEGADGAFVWTFADPWLTHSADPRQDLDMTAISLVKTYARGHGSTYPGMPWEPKQAFGVVATFYATQ